MLAQLRVENFAIIDRLEVEFGSGFNVLSGETGAGKSILIDALILALGGKASPEQIRTGAESAEIEAVFKFDPNSALRKYLQEQGLKQEEELILRRQINVSGKSRAWVNSRSATLGMLYEIGGQIVDIYGQHEYQALLRAEEHLPLLDGYGGLRDKVDGYQEIYAQYQVLKQEYERLLLSERERKEKEDLLRFRVSELKRADLKPGEEEGLTLERERLRHSELLRQASELGYKELYYQDGAIAERLTRIQNELDKVSGYDAKLGQLAKDLETARALVEEAGRELGGYLKGLSSDPHRLEEVEERLAEIRRLKRKYGLELSGLLRLLEESEKELVNLTNYESRIAELSQALERKRKELLSRAEVLTQERRAQGKSLSKKIEQVLKELGMQKTAFEVRFEKLAEPEITGIDRVEFYLSPNPGEELKPLSKIASGGELSRIMLGLRGILAGKTGAEVLVFDEVDAGIGGAVAEVVGKKLYELARKNQVLIVTHLAQIAKFSDQHFQVWKQTEKARTVTRVKTLSREERVEELARMLGGVKITDKIRAYAREMLEEIQR